MIISKKYHIKISVFSAFRSVSRTRLNGSIKYQSPGDTLSILIALSLSLSVMIIVVTQKSLILYVLHIVGFVIVQQGAAKSSVVSRLAFFDRKEIECINNDRRVYTQKQSTRTQRHLLPNCKAALYYYILVDAFCLLSVHFDWRRKATSPSVITCSLPYMNCSRFAN